MNTGIPIASSRHSPCIFSVSGSSSRATFLIALVLFPGVAGFFPVPLDDMESLGVVGFWLPAFGVGGLSLDTDVALVLRTRSSTGATGSSSGAALVFLEGVLRRAWRGLNTASASPSCTEDGASFSASIFPLREGVRRRDAFFGAPSVVSARTDSMIAASSVPFRVALRPRLGVGGF